MNAHEQFADDLALYALGALLGEERATLEAHLKSCPECRAELERLRGDAALLAFSTSGPRPPARSRARLLSAIAAEAPAVPARQPARIEDEPRSTWKFWLGGLGWAAAAAAVIFAVI